MLQRVLMFLCSAAFAFAADVYWPGAKWARVEPEEAGLLAKELEKARDYALSAGGSGRIIHRGKLVVEWGDQEKLYDIKSATKSFGAIALGLAVADRKVALHAPAVKYLPTLGAAPESNKESGWLPKITLFQLATHTAGFEKPGGFSQLVTEPGKTWMYSDCGPNWLADCITAVYHRDIQELMFERVFTPIGIMRKDLRWRNNSYRPRELEGVPRREFGAGIHANVDALARIGYLHLREGQWNDKPIIDRDFIHQATRPARENSGLPEGEASHGNASEQYGLLWWTNGDRTLANVPADAYWAWGLHDSLIVVIPSLEIVAVRGGENGKSWPRQKDANHYDVLKPFLEPIVASVGTVRKSAAPYPLSEIIGEVEWAPAETIVRKARGSDNWPLTWGDDDALYTAYGDGNGFEPFVEKKLSLGFARITGGPADFQGKNVRSAGERLGDGRRGPKASGLLMVEGYSTCSCGTWRIASLRGHVIAASRGRGLIGDLKRASVAPHF